MKNNFIRNSIALAVIALMIMIPKQAYAAEEQSSTRFVNEIISVFGSNGKYFDYAAYADSYPDLMNAFGYNKSALWNHYKTHGVYVGRHVSGTTPGVNAKVTALSVASSVTNEGMTDREKVLAIHNWIVNSTRYDYGNYLANTIPDISYEKEGVFLNHVAVCAGYADAFCYLSKIVGLRCEYVSGYARSGGGHAWNRVFIDGQWLYLDCTWDDPVCTDGSNMLTYEYFLISEEAMNRDHIMETAYALY